MQQQIGFCSTADGTRIAYATVGAGPPLIFAQWISHLEQEWEEPRVRDFWETIGRHHMVIRYDKQGSGLSDRKRTDFSLDSEIRPIEAIVEQLQLESFALWGQGQGAAAATAYAVKFADHVSHLILSNAPWHTDYLSGVLSQDIFRALVMSSTRMASLVVAEAALGNSFDAASLQWFLRVRQESVTAEMLDQLMKFWWNTDLRDLLPKVRVPTLVVHYRNNRLVPFESGREVAAGIVGARFVQLEGDSHILFFNDTRRLLSAVAEFLGDPVEKAGELPSKSAKPPPSPEAVQGISRKEGEFWTIAFWGEVFRLKHVRGLTYIGYLLGHPGEEFHVLSLASKQGEADALAEPATEEQATQPGLTVGRMGDAGEMLDAQAKAAYKRRIAELREQLEEARERNQSEVVDRLEDLRSKLSARNSQERLVWAAVIDGRPRLQSARGST
jgi:pimeloyl-ACP methyl ester carboxylesterase